MQRPLSFQSLLLLILIAVALGSLLLLGTVSSVLHQRDIDQLSADVNQQTLQRVINRLDEFARMATDHQELYPYLAPPGELSSAEFPRIFHQLWTTVLPHEELSYMGLGIEATGEYGMVRHLHGEPPLVRLYLKDVENGPEIRDYLPTKTGLELIEQRPWSNDGDPRNTYDLKTRPFYKEGVAAGTGIWTDSYSFWGGTEIGETPGVTYVTPTYDAQGNLQRIWDISLELKSLSHFLDRVEEQVSGRLVILEHRRDTTWRPLAQSTQATTESISAAAILARGLPPDFQEAKSQAGQIVPLTIGGESWWATYGVLDSPHAPEWVIAEIWPHAAQPRPASFGHGWYLSTFLLIGGAVVATAWSLSRYIAFPLQHLEQEAGLLADGKRTHLPLVGGPREIERLSTTLNRLSESVQQRQAALEAANSELRISRERLQKHFDETPVGALEIDPLGHVVEWNRAAERIFGWTREEVLGRRFDFIVPDAIKPEIEQVVRSIFQHKGGFRNDNQNVTKDGRIIDCEWYNTPLIDPNGETFGIACLVHDVTSRKRAETEIRSLNEKLESRVRERTQELEWANKELESFSYSVAHDLRSPLRSIDGFSQTLMEELGDGLSPTCADHLQRIRNSTQHMAQLIDALLGLTRLVRHEVQADAVNLSELVRQSMSQLQQTDPTRQVHLQIEPDVRVNGDRLLLRVFIENLCDNAWKYSQTRPQTRVEFFSEVRADGRWFAIRDNGVGFDPQYAHKALELFQRLHHFDEFQGHGIGLATAQRIARKHGGCVKLEANPTEGATCWFQLANDSFVHSGSTPSAKTD